MNYSSESEVLADLDEKNVGVDAVDFDLSDIVIEDEGGEAGIARVIASIESTLDRALAQNDNWSNKVTEPAANEVTKRRRRSDRKDVQTLKTIKIFEASTKASGPLAVADFYTPSKTPKDTPANDNRLPAWEHTSDRVKAAMAVRSLADRGGHAFTLNLGPARLADALASSKPFATYIAGYIRRALERKCGTAPDFMFTVEKTPKGKLHIHGAVDATHNQLPAVKRALVHAGGGGWRPARRGETQVSLKPITDADGWARYIFGDGPAARRIVGGRVLFVSKPLRPKAAITYSSLKNKLEGTQSVNTDTIRPMLPVQRSHDHVKPSVSAD